MQEKINLILRAVSLLTNLENYNELTEFEPIKIELAFSKSGGEYYSVIHNDYFYYSTIILTFKNKTDSSTVSFAVQNWKGEGRSIETAIDQTINAITNEVESKIANLNRLLRELNEASL